MSNKTAHGFTLIEVAVVVVLIGIVIGMASLQFGDKNDTAVRTESERLTLLVQAAQEAAILQGDLLLFQVADNGYRFSRVKDDNKIELLERDDVLRPRRLPAGVEIGALEIEGTSEDIGGAWLFPTGEMSAFSVTLRDAKGESRWRVEGAANGEVSFKRATAA